MNPSWAVHSVLTCGLRVRMRPLLGRLPGRYPPRAFGGKVRSGLELAVDFVSCHSWEDGCRLHGAGMDFKGRVV
jgi:hypothetical protein